MPFRSFRSLTFLFALTVPLALTLVALFPSSGAAQGHQHAAPATGDGQYNPSLAVAPDGTFYLAYVEKTGNVSNLMLKTTRNGSAFSTPVRVNDVPGDATVRNENPPKVAVGARGQVYLAWANERGKWKGNIRFARSTDGGKTFAPALTLNSDGAAAPAGHAFQSMVVDTKGSIYIAWIDERNKTEKERGAEIWLTSSLDDGKTFTPDRRVISDVCECCRTSLFIDDSGGLFLSYRKVPSTGPMLRDIVLARSTDGGKSFTDSVVSRDGWEVNGCPVAGPTFSTIGKGKIAAVWFVGGGQQQSPNQPRAQNQPPGLYYAISSDRGATFSPRKLLDEKQRMAKHAQMTALPGGMAFVAWDDVNERSFTAWGVLDPIRGLISRGSDQEGITYPVVGANDTTILIAGMRPTAREIVVLTQGVKNTPMPWVPVRWDESSRGSATRPAPKHEMQ